MCSSAIAVFSKTPNSTEAKTRLVAAGVPAQAVLELQAQLVTTTLGTLTEVTEADLFAFWLPAQDSDFSLEPLQASFATYQHLRQHGETFSQRFSNMIERLKNYEYSATIVVGTDCPFLTKEIYLEAIEALITKQAVYGPAQRGGIYLLGFRTSDTDIDWNRLFASRNQHKEFERIFPGALRLKQLHDIDVKEDLAQLKKTNIRFNCRPSASS